METYIGLLAAAAAQPMEKQASTEAVSSYSMPIFSRRVMSGVSSDIQKLAATYNPNAITRAQMRQYRKYTGAGNMNSDMDKWKTWQAMQGNRNASNADYWAWKRGQKAPAPTPTPKPAPKPTPTPTPTPTPPAPEPIDQNALDSLNNIPLNPVQPPPTMPMPTPKDMQPAPPPLPQSDSAGVDMYGNSVSKRDTWGSRDWDNPGQYSTINMTPSNLRRVENAQARNETDLARMRLQQQNGMAVNPSGSTITPQQRAGMQSALDSYFASQQ